MNKIKNDGVINIGENIRRIRLSKAVGQTELVRMVQLTGVDLTRQALVKIESGNQHITATQLAAICKCLDTTYDELLQENR